MKYKLEVFFDYACPFCMRGHEYLKELYPLYPEIEIVWCPCEAHPRPDRYGLHSDLCIRGMFFALDNGVDIWAYHDRMFRLALADRIDIEDMDTLAASVRGLLHADAFRESLKNGEYIQTLQDANDYAYRASGVWAVPSYRMFTLKNDATQEPYANVRKLDSIENIGVSKQQLAAFLDAAKHA